MPQLWAHAEYKAMPNTSYAESFIDRGQWDRMPAVTEVARCSELEGGDDKLTCCRQGCGPELRTPGTEGSAVTAVLNALSVVKK